MLRLLILLLLLGAFNGSFFLFNDSETINMATWITYGFINFGITLPFIFSMLQYKRPENMVTILTVSTIYAVVEFIIGIIILMITPECFKVPLFIQGFVAIVAVILCMSLFKLENFKR